MNKTKSFNLMSGREEDTYWRINCRIFGNGSFKSKGSFNFRTDEEHRENQREYRESHKLEQMKHNSKRRGLGFLPMNEYEPGLCCHHVTDNCVVFIDPKIHQACVRRGISIEEHRKRVFDILCDTNPELALKVARLLDSLEDKDIRLNFGG